MEEIDIDPSAPSAGEYVRLKKVYFEFDHSNGMDHAWGIRQDINGAWECISEIGLVIKTPLQVELHLHRGKKWRRLSGLLVNEENFVS
jgi:hypothetical protein